MSYTVSVLIKPYEEQIALERAAAFAQCRADLKVIAIRIVNHFNEEDKEVLTKQYTAEVEHLLQKRPTIKNYQVKVIFAHDVAEAFCDANQNPEFNIDMAIVATNKSRTFRDLFMTSIHSRIMHKIHVPLLVVKNANAPHRLGKAIVVPVDLEESHHDAFMDEVIINAANIFAENLNGEVNLVECVAPFNTGLMGGTILSNLILGEQHGQMASSEHSKVIFDFADKHNVPHNRCHIAEGRVDEMIPKVCEVLDARMVCIGISNKSGIFSAIDQNTSDLVLEQIQGDIFIVNKNVVFKDGKLSHAARVYHN